MNFSETNLQLCGLSLSKMNSPRVLFLYLFGVLVQVDISMVMNDNIDLMEEFSGNDIINERRIIIITEKYNIKDLSRFFLRWPTLLLNGG